MRDKIYETLHSINLFI